MVSQGSLASPFRSHATVPSRNVSSQPSLWVPSRRPAALVEEPERARRQPQHGDVGWRAHRQVTELLELDHLRRVPGRAQNHVLQRHPQREELAHDVEHVLHARVHAADVKVGRDGVGIEAFLEGLHGRAEHEAPGPVADVEDDALLLRREDGRVDLAVDELPTPPAGVGMREDVARTEDPAEQLRDGAHPRTAEVHHHRDAGDRACLDRTRERVPLGSVEVSALDADDQALVLECHLRGGPGLHVGQVLLEGAASHPVPDDVQERRDARLRRVDDTTLEVVEVAPARAARVGHRGRAASQREGVHGHAIGPAGILGSLTVVHVDVHVQETGGHVQPRGVDGLCRLGRRDVRGDGGDLAPLDRDVPHGVDPVPGIDDVAALDQQVVGGLGAGGARERKGEQQ